MGFLDSILRRVVIVIGKVRCLKTEALRDGQCRWQEYSIAGNRFLGQKRPEL
jgi:hypothetical protein